MSSQVRNFWDLSAWQITHQLALQIYRITSQFPSKERFALSNQMKRAAVSISSNIAEGFSRLSKKEKQYFYSIALGSITELQCQLMLARDLDYIDSAVCDTLISHFTMTRRPINGLIRSAFSAPPNT